MSEDKDDLVLKDEKGEPLNIEVDLELDWFNNGWLSPYWSVFKRIQDYDKKEDKDDKPRRRH